MNQKGFSLIEMLVVMALFLTLMLVVSDIFLSVSLVQRKTIASLQAVNDLQFNLEQMVQAARLNKLDYDYYDLPLINPVEELALVSSNGEKIIFKKTGAGCPAGVAACLSEKIGEAKPMFIISSNNINIEKLNFFILPGVNPYEFDSQKNQYASDHQPQVLIFIQGKTLGIKSEDQRVINLQTAVSSRYYER